jgi:hypothetical protein
MSMAMTESTNVSRTDAAAANSTGSRPARGQRGGQPRGAKDGSWGAAPKPRPPQEVVKTWAFDSVGTRKYALQIRKASNGNPCIKFVEGVPQADGTFRKFDLTVWSEDWPRLFEMLDALRAFVTEQNIRTPDGHKFDPNRKPKWKKK